MPYRWQPLPDSAPDRAGTGGPVALLHLWPFRSLPRRGFVWFIGATALLLALPLVGLVGTPVLWGLLPFLLAALWGIWHALQRSYRDGEITEELALWSDRITLTRTDPRGQRRVWEANPHWVRVTLHETGGPVPNYLTLSGAGREVELGAFLSEEERVALCHEVRAALARTR